MLVKMKKDCSFCGQRHMASFGVRCKLVSRPEAEAEDSNDPSPDDEGNLTSSHACTSHAAPKLVGTCGIPRWN